MRKLNKNRIKISTQLSCHRVSSISGTKIVMATLGTIGFFSIF